MLSNNLAYKILSQKYKTLFIKIDLLDWSEEKIGEIAGMASSGSLSIQGNSSTRRTCSLTMEVQNNLENILKWLQIVEEKLVRFYYKY